jgi:O-antigen ligase
VAFAVAALCGAGTIFSLTRQVWLGTIIASLVVVVCFRELRRYALPVALGVAVVALITVFAVPSFGDKFNERRGNQRPVWERENMNVAALNMIRDKPLLGVGWTQYPPRKRDYFELAPNRPLVGGQADLPVHNVFLLYGSELGLIGVGLWLGALALLLGRPMFARPPPELQPWRIALVAITVFYVVVANFVYPVGFTLVLIALLWAVVVGGTDDAKLQTD